MADNNLSPALDSTVFWREHALALQRERDAGRLVLEAIADLLGELEEDCDPRLLTVQRLARMGAWGVVVAL